MGCGVCFFPILSLRGIIDMADMFATIPGPDGKPVKGQILEFKTEREEWNIYKLEDGTTLRAKLIAIQVMKGHDPATGEAIYLPNGEPLYNIRNEIRVVADVPEFLLRKEE